MDEGTRRSTPPGRPISALRTTADGNAADDLDQIGAAVDHARTARPGTPQPVDSAPFLTALALLRHLREHLAGWEPELIDAARAHGASWADLAPALGVASRQAAERRALRLRPDAGHNAVTGEGRVTAERDRRAQARAVHTWAQDQAAHLRILAAQVGALSDLPKSADAPMAALHTALGAADAADLLQPLIDARAHLGPDHHALAAQVDALSGAADTLRADTLADRRR